MADCEVSTRHVYNIICPKCRLSLYSHKAGDCLDQWVYTGVLLGKIKAKKAPKVSTSQKEIGRFVEVFDVVSISQGGAYLSFVADLQGQRVNLFTRYKDATVPLSLCKAALLIAYTKPSDIISDYSKSVPNYSIWDEDEDDSEEEEESSEYDDE